MNSDNVENDSFDRDGPQIVQEEPAEGAKDENDTMYNEEANNVSDLSGYNYSQDISADDEE